MKNKLPKPYSLPKQKKFWKLSGSADACSSENIKPSCSYLSCCCCCFFCIPYGVPSIKLLYVRGFTDKISQHSVIGIITFFTFFFMLTLFCKNSGIWCMNFVKLFSNEPVNIHCTCQEKKIIFPSFFAQPKLALFCL